MNYLIIKIKPRGIQKKPLIIVVSRKVAKKAYPRNKLKRRLRTIMRPIVKTANKDYLIIAKPGANRLTFQELKKELLDNYEIRTQYENTNIQKLSD